MRHVRATELTARGGCREERVTRLLCSQHRLPYKPPGPLGVGAIRKEIPMAATSVLSPEGCLCVFRAEEGRGGLSEQWRPRSPETQSWHCQFRGHHGSLGNPKGIMEIPRASWIFWGSLGKDPKHVGIEDKPRLLCPPAVSAFCARVGRLGGRGRSVCGRRGNVCSSARRCSRREGARGTRLVK